MKVYTSGQITGLTHEEYHDNFARADELVIAENWIPVNPLKVEACSDRKCGGGKVKPDGEQLHDYTCYMKHDIKAMLECQAIAMLPNWRKSNGAKSERSISIICGLQVFYIDRNYERILT